MTQPFDLDAVKRRLAARTPGVWRWTREDHGDEYVLICASNLMAGDRQIIGHEGITDRDAPWTPEEIDADAALIENAPADLAAACAEVERLRAALKPFVRVAEVGLGANNLGGLRRGAPDDEDFYALTTKLGEAHVTAGDFRAAAKALDGGGK